ncbi:MAG: flagellar biosynthetic protein FliO [Myxococcota bacterium]|nr:flagellar biosynthetic protein FliO [Myxococcota bacterium]
MTLGAVCALAALVLWGARRLGVARGSGPIGLRGHLPLDSRRAIYLVEVGERVFVLGVGEGGFTKLGELSANDLPEVASGAHSRTFGDVLSRVLAAKRAGSGSGTRTGTGAVTGIPSGANGRGDP